MSHTTYSEMMTDTASSWLARSLDNAYRLAGVETPVSGDKLATLRAPYCDDFYRRSRDIERREWAAETGHLWAEGDL